ncbi:MAG TPA: phosphate signaling complex protein PhoU [Bryobacteraceae bacterium]|nr:phosphate signaling complex protein PhoU [Bryobacteraceae bacterium]
MRHFSTELGELHAKLAEMGGLVEANIRRSVRALTDRDPEQAHQVMRDEERINQMQMDIDNLTTRLLVLNQPMARDLRFLTAALKINTDLERVGDLAVNIARRALTLMQSPPIRAVVDIPRMVSLVEGMLVKSLDAFVQENAELAQSVLVCDDEVDDLRDTAYNELVSLMQKDSTTIPSAIAWIFVARNLERIADHATNIAEDVIFLIKGVDVRHHAPVPDSQS